MKQAESIMSTSIAGQQPVSRDHGDPSEAVGVGAARGRVLTPITYYPITMQKQFFLNRKALNDQPYVDFWREDLRVSSAWAKALQRGPLPADQTLTPSIEDINKILDPSYTFPDSGNALLDGPSAYSSKDRDAGCDNGDV